MEYKLKQDVIFFIPKDDLDLIKIGILCAKLPHKLSTSKLLDKADSSEHKFEEFAIHINSLLEAYLKDE